MATTRNSRRGDTTTLDTGDADAKNVKRRRHKTARLGGVPLFATPLPIVRPTFPAAEDLVPDLKTILASGRVTNNGPFVVEFERRLTEYLGADTLVFCNGQTALLTMIKASGIERGEVIVPAFTFPATVHAIRWAGATPVFADILDDGSFRISPDDVRRKINDKTVAILAVDPYGIACDYEEIDEIGRNRHLRVLYDSAAAFGTRMDGHPVGAFGDAQIFSFHATKAFSCMEGGALCSRDATLLRRARAIRNFGQVAEGDFKEVGLNGKMMEVSALVGLKQMPAFELSRTVRLRSVERLRRGLEKLPGVSVGRAPERQEPIWLYLPVVIDEEAFGLDRDEAAAALQKGNLHVRKYYSPPCHVLAPYLENCDTPLEVTEFVAGRVLALPVYNDMKDHECDMIVQAFADTQLATGR
jgi:dTDP-4-amino-4,6-dideoxyglucose